MIIGVTGPSGAGKSTVTEYLSKNYGYFIIDADKIAREITSKGSKALDEISEEFGKSYITDDGVLDRKKLGTLVFSSKEKLDKLNRITHKYIIDNIKILAKNNKNAVIDAPLLFETGLEILCDKLILVLCDEKVRIERIMKRDSISYEDAQKRIRSQNNYEDFISKCHIVINNVGVNISQQLAEVEKW